MENLGKGIINAVDQLALDISGFVNWNELAVDVQTKATRADVEKLLGYLSYAAFGQGNINEVEEDVDIETIELQADFSSTGEAANKDVEFIESDNFEDLLDRSISGEVMEVEELAVLIMKFARAVNSVFVYEDECYGGERRQLRFVYTGVAKVETGFVENQLHGFSFWDGFHVEYPVGVVSRGSVTPSSVTKIEYFSRNRDWFCEALNGGTLLVGSGFRYVTGRSEKFFREDSGEDSGEPDRIVRSSYDLGALTSEAGNTGSSWMPTLTQVEQVEEGRVLFKNGEREYVDVKSVRDMFSMYNANYKILIDMYCQNGYTLDEACRLNNLKTKAKLKELLDDVNFLRTADLNVLLSLRNIIKQIEMVERLKKVLWFGIPVEVLPKPEIHGVPADLFKEKI